jgi:hypothetical protein
MVYLWDRENDPTSQEVELPDGLTGRDLADLAELRVQDAWEQDAELPFKREVVTTPEGVSVMNWRAGDPCRGLTYSVTIALCPGNDAAAKAYVDGLVESGRAKK